jgi:hypothetical protein
MEKHKPQNWWELEAGQDGLLQALNETMYALDELDGERYEANMLHMSMYGNLKASGLSLAGTALNEAIQLQRKSNPNIRRRRRTNFSKQFVNAIYNNFSTKQPAVKHSVHGAKGDARLKAEYKDKYIRGAFASSRVYDETAAALHDTLVLGTGAVKVYPCSKQVRAERTFIGDVLVDPEDGKHRKPRSIYQCVRMDATVCADKWASDDEEKYGKIMSSEDLRPGRYLPEIRTMTTPISCCEAYHLLDDGVRHVVWVSGCILLDEIKKQDSFEPCFPIKIYRWNIRPLGFWGEGIPEIILDNQADINRLDDYVSEAMMTNPGNTLLVPNGAQINEGHYNNAPHSIMYHNTQSSNIKMLKSPGITGDYHSWRETIKQDARDAVGVNEMLINGTMPPTNSGDQVVQLSDQQEKRLGKHALEFERWHVEIARQFYIEAKEIKGMDVFSADESGRLEKIEWSQMDLTKETEIQPWPAGLLADTPAARQQQVMELMRLGDERLTGMLPKILRYSDFESIVGEAFSLSDYQDSQYRNLLQGDPIDPPSKEMMPEEMMIFWQNMYFKSSAEGMEPEKIGKIRAWLKKCNSIIEERRQAEAAMMAQAQMQAAGQQGA